MTPSHAFSVRGYTRTQVQILLTISCDRNLGYLNEPYSPTYTMSTWVLPITLGPQLIALIASPADPSPYGPGGTRYSRAGPAIWVLAKFRLGRPREMRSMDADMLLKMLEGVLRTVAECV